MRKIFLTIVVALMVLPVAAQTEKDVHTVIDSLTNRIDSLESVIWELKFELLNQEANKLIENGIKLPYGSKVYDTPISYENKKSSNFKVFQALPGYALAHERSKESYLSDTYYGKVVLLLGNFYDDQIIKIKQPMIKGIYTYTTKNNSDKSVPIIVSGKE